MNNVKRLLMLFGVSFVVLVTALGTVKVGHVHASAGDLTLSSTLGQPGVQVTVTVSDQSACTDMDNGCWFDVRWGDPTSGPILCTVQAPAQRVFTCNVTIPTASPGSYPISLVDSQCAYNCTPYDSSSFEIAPAFCIDAVYPTSCSGLTSPNAVVYPSDVGVDPTPANDPVQGNQPDPGYSAAAATDPYPADSVLSVNGSDTSSPHAPVPPTGTYQDLSAAFVEAAANGGPQIRRDGSNTFVDPDGYSNSPPQNRYSGKSGTASVRPYREPDLAAYYNFCGPVSTQTLLSNQLSSAQMPTLDTVGYNERVNVYGPGVLLTNMVPYINKFVSANTAYQVKRYYGPKGLLGFNNIVGADIAHFHLPLISAIQTKGTSSTSGNLIYLKGWQPNKYQSSGQGINSAHIVTIYGFDFTSSLHANYTLNYVEGSSHAAGNASTGRNTYNDFDFYDLYLTDVAYDHLPAGAIVHIS